MSVKLRHFRSRSTSDILDEERSQKNSVSLENKYKTYSFVDCKKDNCEQRKEHLTRKSQNFVKKLIASLEGTNEVCKADDEFLTTYYRRNDEFYLNSDYSCVTKSKASDEIEKTGTRSTILDVTMDKLSLQDFKQEQNTKSKFVKNASIYVNGNKNILLQKCSNIRDIKYTESCKCEKENGSKINEQQKFVDTESIQMKREGLLLGINGNNEQQRFLDFCSSFNSSILQVDSQNRSDAQDSCISKQKKNTKRNMLERIFFVNKEDKCSVKKLHGDIHTKKLNRNKTFKDFITSMIKRKKSGNEEKSQFFMSNGRVLENLTMFDSKSSRKLPTVPYFQDVVFQEDKKGDLK
ncbi:uncharacterized protein LOC113463845 [Ceratina calcarata]|uniref:Uncharacterized protein LOC113463845 n=1 Tax=Ceratina calcarata TaxID=156304 RepID=A0AAJ7RWE4_9HYME|nr:uncharacterized protein LOC113463845 [Ceratina calcarata]